MIIALPRIRLRPATAFSAVIAAILALCAAAAARAAVIGDASVPYSATRTVRIQDKTYTGRMWSIPGAQRHEQTVNGLRFIAILRIDRRLAWLVLPDLHVYAELPFEDSWLRLAHASVGPRVGTAQTPGGIATKYRVDHSEADGASFHGFVLLSRQGIPDAFTGNVITAHGRKTAIAMLLSNIAEHPQPEALFEAPADMTRLPPEAVRPLLGIRNSP